MACVKCFRVWTCRKMNFSVIDMENLNRHNQLYIECKECSHTGKEISVLYDGDEFKAL